MVVKFTWKNAEMFSYSIEEHQQISIINNKDIDFVPKNEYWGHPHALIDENGLQNQPWFDILYFKLYLVWETAVLTLSWIIFD